MKKVLHKNKDIKENRHRERVWS